MAKLVFAQNPLNALHVYKNELLHRNRKWPFSVSLTHLCQEAEGNNSPLTR